jgi:dCMP deaminase
MKRRVGAILVRNNRILATGCVIYHISYPIRKLTISRYNGTARGLKNCSEGGCTRCNAGTSSGVALDECICLHAEENALLEAGRERIGDETTLYCDT